MTPELTDCEVCGMRWTARRHELCPRCLLVDAREDADRAWAQAQGATKTRDALQVKLINMVTERDSLEKDLAGAQETIAAARKRAEHAETRVKELKSQNADLDEEVANNDAERDEAIEQRDAARARVSELERLLAHARETAAEPLEDKRVIQARCAELEKERDVYRETADLVPGLQAQVETLLQSESRAAELSGVVSLARQVRDRSVLTPAWETACVAFDAAIYQLDHRAARAALAPAPSGSGEGGGKP